MYEYLIWSRYPELQFYVNLALLEQVRQQTSTMIRTHRTHKLKARPPDHKPQQCKLFLHGGRLHSFYRVIKYVQPNTLSVRIDTINQLRLWCELFFRCYCVNIKIQVFIFFFWIIHVFFFNISCIHEGKWVLLIY